MNHELAIGPVSVGVGFALRDWCFGVQMLFGVCGGHHVRIGFGPISLWAEYYTDV